MFGSNNEVCLADDINAHVSQAAPATKTILSVLAMPAVTVEVIIRECMGWKYVLIGLFWGSLFIGLMGVATKLEHQSLNVFLVFFWVGALAQVIRLLVAREEVLSSSSGRPHRLWDRIVGRSLPAQRLVLLIGEPALVYGVAWLSVTVGVPVLGGLLGMASVTLFLKNAMSLLVWAYRRNMAIDSRILGQAMQNVHRPAAQPMLQAQRSQVVHQISPPAPPP